MLLAARDCRYLVVHFCQKLWYNLFIKFHLFKLERISAERGGGAVRLLSEVACCSRGL